MAMCREPPYSVGEKFTQTSLIFPRLIMLATFTCSVMFLLSISIRSTASFMFISIIHFSFAERASCLCAIQHRVPPVTGSVRVANRLAVVALFAKRLVIFRYVFWISGGLAVDRAQWHYWRVPWHFHHP